MWTLEEANSAIPIITAIFDEIFSLNEQVDALKKDLAVLHDIWGCGLLEPSNPDNGYYKQLRQKRSALLQRIERAVEKLGEAGCHVEDSKRGVVHFYNETPHGIAAFCWRYGEQKINYWHEVGWKPTKKPITQERL
jgi:hypothetical protein